MKRNNIIILGDLNADLLNRNAMITFDMTNVISELTRITADGSSLINVILTSNSSKVKVSGSYDPGISDHKLVYAVINLFRKRSRPKIRLDRNYKSLDIESLHKTFERAPWHICGIFDDPDDIAWAWEQLYKDMIQQHLPSKKLKTISDSLPWIDSKLCKEMNIRYKLLNKAQKSMNNDDWSKNKIQRNKVTSLLRKAEAG